jgi:SprT protein
MPDKQDHRELEQQAETAVRCAEMHACAFYGIDLPTASIDFSLRGRCAGQACIARNGQVSLRINRQLLAENLDDFLNQTIPHEVAHLVVNWPYRKKRQRPQPHGLEWQAVMQNCFGLEPKRCHSYQTTPARIVPRLFLYRCNCREHKLTSIMHNKIHRSVHALCKACKTPLKFMNRQQP